MMKRLLLLCFALFLAMNLSVAQKKKGAKSIQEPPLIDRELFFDNPEIAGGQLSPDGKLISFLKVNKGKMNIWVKSFDEPFEKAKPITADTLRPIGGYFWTSDSKYILYVQDKGGNENFHVYAVDPFGVPTSMGVPEARDLTPMENVRAFIYNVSKKNPNIMWVGINNRDQAWHDLFQLEISTGKLTLLRENKERLTGFYFDWDEKIRLATRSADDGSTEILRADEDGFTKIYDCAPLENCGPSGFFDKENKTFYFESNKGENENLTKLYQMDPATQEVKLVEGDPLNKVDFDGVTVSDVSRQILFTTYTDAKTRWYFKDKNFEASYKFLQAKFKGKEIGFNSMTKDESKALISVYSDDDPGSVYFFDFKTKKVIKQYTPRPKLQSLPLAKMEPITYKSSDGLEIPAYLTLPLGKEPKNLPVIVLPHGGPWARDNWGYNSFAQFMANRGYAVLMMNFRGSTGYGKKFLNAGNLQWGEKMQDDITWGVKHLISQGIADPKRVGIMGGSYGGYATLAGLTFTPDVYAAGVDIVGPSNLLTLLNSIPPYWESFRKIFHIRMGDPGTPEGKAKLEKQSPLFSASKIKVPLLVVQGANDPRVKKAESDQIVSALRDLGIGVEYLCAMDEGHGFRNPENNMAMLAYAEKFLAKHLGGRYQEGMKPEVAKKLQDMTVDIKTVKAPEKVSTFIPLPKPTEDLKEGKFNYAVKLAAGPQNIAMDMTRDVKKENGKWTIVDAVKSPMGEIREQSTLEPVTLKCLMRMMKQGPATVEMNYSDAEVNGHIDMGNGQKKPMTIKLERPIAVDGAGADLVLARVPFKENETVTMETVDVMTAQIKKYEVKLIGTEKITVPAGSFDTYIISMNQIDGGEKSTFWISSSDKKMIKTEAILPQMGNAKMTVELK